MIKKYVLICGTHQASIRTATSIVGRELYRALSCLEEILCTRKSQILVSCDFYLFFLVLRSQKN